MNNFCKKGRTAVAGVPARSAILCMDNAPFHQSPNIRELIENAGCELLFLLPYSPDFHPIEHWWQKLKTAKKNYLSISLISTKLQVLFFSVCKHSSLMIAERMNDNAE